MKMRISNCCKVEVQNKYLCPKCGKICKSSEVEMAKNATSEPEVAGKACKTENEYISPLFKHDAPESPKNGQEIEVSPSIFYHLTSYMGCEGVLTIKPGANIHYSYESGSVATLTSYILGYVKDDLVEFKPILHVKRELCKLEERMYADFKRDWDKNFYFLDRPEKELFWILSEKNFFRSLSFDMDDLISQGKAIEAQPLDLPDWIKDGSTIGVNVRDDIKLLHIIEEFENGFYALHDEEAQADQRAEIDLIDQERHL